jgi:phospholipid N-methyltransferase
MNWDNIDLESGAERDQNILDPITFDILLLEISCNLKTEELTAKEIKKHFLDKLRAQVDEAKEIFNNNLDNIVRQAIKERKRN